MHVKFLSSRQVQRLIEKRLRYLYLRRSAVGQAIQALEAYHGYLAAPLVDKDGR